MRNHYLSLCMLVVILSSFAYAQRQRLELRHSSREVTWREGSANCDAIIVDGDSFRIINDKDITVAFAAGDAGDYYVAKIYIVNNGKDRVDLDPENFRIAYWKKMDDKVGDWLYRVPPEKIAARYTKRAQWAAFFRAFGAGMAQTTTTSQESGTVSVVSNSGRQSTGIYTGTTTTTTPDYKAQLAAQQANAKQWAQTKSFNEWIMASSLKANTLFLDQQKYGLVYFERKKFAWASFILRIGTVDYYFVVTPARK